LTAEDFVGPSENDVDDMSTPSLAELFDTLQIWALRITVNVFWAPQCMLGPTSHLLERNDYDEPLAPRHGMPNPTKFQEAVLR